jgi:hypothetical protein
MDSSIGMSWMARVGRTARMLALATLASMLAAAPASAFRAFSATSPWNLSAAAKGPIDAGNPYAGQFLSYSSKLAISGTPDNPDYASPTFFAAAGDPSIRNVTLTTDWSPQRDLKWDGRAIPVPAGAYPAPGSDGHMTIVSADRRTAFEFWRCTRVSASGITAAVIVQWDLTGPGYSANRGENSARGSGTPLISTTLRAEEALTGIDHALGITVPRVSGDYVYPVATHSDGSLGSTGIRYGMLFVLRADYPVPANASIGVRNVIQALKTYGAYVVDQGASFEMDADSTQPQVWAQAGLSQNSLSITPADMRYVQVPGSPAAPNSPAPSPAPTPGSGRGPGAGKDKRQGLVQVKRAKRWRTVGTTAVRADGKFRLKLPARLRHARHKLRIRVVVPGIGVAKELVLRPRR